MAGVPNLDRAVVDPRKLTHYLLAHSHPVGRSKARFFESLGFVSTEAEVLANALREHAQEPDVITIRDTGFGTKYIADGSLRGPTGTAHVRTVWIVESGSEVPRFVTAYPWS